jgi:hypothetical protein
MAEAKKENKTSYYEVKQAIAHNGQSYYPARKAGDKTIPADIVEMDDDRAGAYGKNYLKKVDKPKDKDK